MFVLRNSKNDKASLRIINESWNDAVCFKKRFRFDDATELFVHASKQTNPIHLAIRCTSISERSDLTTGKRCSEHRIQLESCEQNDYVGQKVIRGKMNPVLCEQVLGYATKSWKSTNSNINRGTRPVNLQSSKLWDFDFA